MLAVIEVIILPGAVLLLVAFAVLHEWGLKRLRWRQLTGDNCRRYLMAKGWHCLDYNDNSAVMDKGDLHVFIRCVEVDPATLLTLQSEFDDRPVMPDRLAVILVPGDIAPGAVEQMREREISVMSYKRLNDFDEFVRVEKRLIDAVRAFKKRLADPSHTEFTA